MSAAGTSRRLASQVHVDVAANAEAAAELAASSIAVHLHAAVAARGRASLALSGGSTPARMIELLAADDLPWSSISLFQVDERVVADDDLARNWHTLSPIALRLPSSQCHPIPIDGVDATDEQALGAAVDAYAETLRATGGDPPVLDVVHLGLGDDGHTASLTPGDPALQASHRSVAATVPYRGHRRITLTFPVINAARAVVWLVVGADKSAAVAALARQDPGLVASRVARDRATLIVDSAAGQGALSAAFTGWPPKA